MTTPARLPLYGLLAEFEPEALVEVRKSAPATPISKATGLVVTAHTMTSNQPTGPTKLPTSPEPPARQIWIIIGVIATLIVALIFVMKLILGR